MVGRWLIGLLAGSLAGVRSLGALVVCCVRCCVVVEVCCVLLRCCCVLLRCCCVLCVVVVFDAANRDDRQNVFVLC